MQILPTHYINTIKHTKGEIFFICSTHPRALVLIRGVLRLRKPFFLAGAGVVSGPSSTSTSRCFERCERSHSHVARARARMTPRAPKVPNTAVRITSLRSMPTWKNKIFSFWFLLIYRLGLIKLVNSFRFWKDLVLILVHNQKMLKINFAFWKK